jgi:hypothetical protein
MLVHMAKAARKATKKSGKRRRPPKTKKKKPSKQRRRSASMGHAGHGGKDEDENAPQEKSQSQDDCDHPCTDDGAGGPVRGTTDHSSGVEFRLRESKS